MDDNEPDEPAHLNNERTHALFALGLIRAMAANDAAELSVSLLVSGSWITGEVISARKYIDGLTAALERSSLPEGFTSGWATAMEPIISRLLDEPFHDELAVHLRDARIWLPDGTAVNKALLSIRSDAVDAFVLGRTERSSS